MHRKELELMAELNELISVEWYEDCVLQTCSGKTGCEEEGAVLGWAVLDSVGQKRTPHLPGTPPSSLRGSLAPKRTGELSTVPCSSLSDSNSFLEISRL